MLAPINIEQVQKTASWWFIKKNKNTREIFRRVTFIHIYVTGLRNLRTIPDQNLGKV